jgi:hypothetical protein
MGLDAFLVSQPGHLDVTAPAHVATVQAAILVAREDDAVPANPRLYRPHLPRHLDTADVPATRIPIAERFIPS